MLYGVLFEPQLNEGCCHVRNTRVYQVYRITHLVGISLGDLLHWAEAGAVLFSLLPKPLC